MKSTTESGRDVPVSENSAAKAPALYQGFDGQYIDGAWRPGKHGQRSSVGTMAVFPQPMKNVCLIYWAAIAASVALTSCEKPKATAETGPPEVLVTEVIQREVPIIREWLAR